MRVLAADIGGTKTLVHIAETNGTRINVLHQARFTSTLYKDFESLLLAFLEQTPVSLRNTITGACFGVAGPITGPDHGPRQAMVTNLPWCIDVAKLRDLLQMPRVCLINDFFATASGIEALNKEDLDVISPASGKPRAPCLVVGAGTGLGVAQLLWCDGSYRAIASEGGHVHFAPTDDLQIELLGHLLKRYGRVSYERLLSGSGLVNIYQFLAQRHLGINTEELPPPEAGTQDPAAMIVDLARSGNFVARQSLRMFISIYGAAVGDLALVSLAYGGVYIAGGIAPKLRVEMREGGFVEAYEQKGRMSPLVKQMPVSIILSQDAGLLGATLVASRL